jgi:hypothetical protein
MEVARDFSMPTLEEIKNFFEQMTYPSGLKMDQQARQQEAIKFFHHFESNGWLVGGKSPMRNWKAGCRSWVAKIPYFSRTPIQTQKTRAQKLPRQSAKELCASPVAQPVST